MLVLGQQLELDEVVVGKLGVQAMAQDLNLQLKDRLQLGLVQMQHVLLSLSKLNKLQLLLALMLRNPLGKLLLKLLVRMPVYKLLLPLSLLGQMLPSLLLSLSLLWALLRDLILTMQLVMPFPLAKQQTYPFKFSGMYLVFILSCE